MASKGKKSTQRKLTAILCADVVGYSRLMGDNEEATIKTLTSYRKVFVSKIKKHHGSVVDAKGDAILAEFASVVDAVKGAVAIQRELAEKNTELSDDRRMDFRIGINLGDVVVKDDVIYGDGVNVAARLEALAEPGGICISRPVFDQVESKLNLECDYLGEQKVKNIEKPVRAYRVLTRPGDAAHQTVQAEQLAAQPEPSELPDWPSIAALPFSNMSGDSEKEFFGDGLVEDILTSLSKVSSMTVIARNSTFAYKGKGVDVRQVAQELGVRYVLEGSVRHSGNRLRITAQLIDASNGSHIWAEKYDRVVEDIFEIQDEITKEIVTALRVRLTDSEKALVLSRGTDNVQAWGYCVQALEFFHKFNPAAHASARELAEKSLQLDPDYSVACAILGFTHWFDARAGFSGDRGGTLSRAKALAEKALSLDGANPYCLGLNANVQISLRNFEAAIAFAEKAVALNPASAQARLSLGFALLHGGRAEEAVSRIEDAMRLNPWHPPPWKSILARALDSIGRTTEAMEVIEAGLKTNPNQFGLRFQRAGILAKEGPTDEAKEAVADLRRIHPSFRVAHVDEFLVCRDRVYVETFSEALRKAGLPE